MSITPFLRPVFYSWILCSVISIVGCSSGGDSDSAYYVGNEEATREHMQEVQDEERIHNRQTGGESAVQTQGNSVEDQERAQTRR